jgi:hypothetical protein
MTQTAISASTSAGSPVAVRPFGTTPIPLNKEKFQTKKISITSHNASNKMEAGMKCRNTLSIMAARPSDLAAVMKADPVVKKADPA